VSTTDIKNKQECRSIKVFVAVSGGVDSSVALALLKGQGYDVTGVYFKTYKPDGNREYCKEQGMDAQAVCKHLNVPFKVFDLEHEYEQKVFNYMIEGYKAGRTPNPDILCNKEIKFGVFAHKAFQQGADYIATGHYARVKESHGKTMLLKGIDHSKDQSYFLSQVSNKTLERTLFPLGEMKKSEVREFAKYYGLHTASKKDSQGICFIGQEIDVKEFLKRYIQEQEGEVIDVDGKVIGKHKGVHFSTIGERHGFTILPSCQSTHMPRFFVIERDIQNNTLTVGTKEQLEAIQKTKKEIIINNCNWLSGRPVENYVYDCRVRHRGELYKADVLIQDEDSQTIQINFKETPYAPAPGQFIALYDSDVCIGGGEII